MNDIISKAIEQLLVYFVHNQIPFSFIADIDEEWKAILPKHLVDSEKLLFEIINSDLEDSYIDVDGNIIITLGVDNVVYKKILTAADIHAIGEYNVPFTIIKPFIDDKATITASIEASVEYSMKCLEKYNPHLFYINPPAS